jgi:hypothetical protein
MLYEENDPVFEERLALYRTLCLPRLRLQTVKDFDILILCNEKHAKFFKELGLKTIHTRDGFLGHRPRGLYNSFTPYENIKGLDKYDIQTSLDSDDLVSDNYIWRIEKAIESEGYDKSLHIFFQEELYNPHTFERKSMRIRYGVPPNNWGSAFFSLYQPNKDNYVYIGTETHLHMGKYADKSILIGEGYCWATIHGNNDSTTMNS